MTVITSYETRTYVVICTFIITQNDQLKEALEAERRSVERYLTRRKRTDNTEKQVGNIFTCLTHLNNLHVAK